VFGSGATHPVADVVDRGVRRRCGRGCSSGRNDRRSAFGHSRDEGVARPCLVEEVECALAVDLGAGQIGVLGRGVVAPHGHVADGAHGDVEVAGQLGDRPVVVQPHHRGEPIGGDVGCVGAGDESVGIGGVADDQDPDVVGGVCVERGPLWAEDTTVGLEQVGSLHALATRSGSDQQGDARSVEGAAGVVGDLDAVQQGEGAVVEFHRGAFGGPDRLRDLQQLEPHRSVRAEELPDGDAEQQRVGDLTGSAGHRHRDGFRGHDWSCLCDVAINGPDTSSGGR
jgi:hypothetical protein